MTNTDMLLRQMQEAERILVWMLILAPKDDRFDRAWDSASWRFIRRRNAWRLQHQHSDSDQDGES